MLIVDFGQDRFLMLSVTYDNERNQLRVSQAAVGIFAVAILTAGFSLTGLSCFAVRSPLFQSDAVLVPACVACAIGLLTVFYNFLTSMRYVWNTPAVLITIAAAISTIIYGIVAVWIHRRVARDGRPRNFNVLDRRASQPPLARAASANSTTSLWQDPGYYENYVRNMFPASAHPGQQQHSYSPHSDGPLPPLPPPISNGYDPNCITEEEMQRQQMLMLLLQKEPSPATARLPNSHTYNIDWQGREDDDLISPPPPPNGYYAPSQSSPSLSPPYATQRPGMVRQLTSELATHPWDGVWRGPGPPPPHVGSRAVSGEGREERRRQIEQGR